MGFPEIADAILKTTTTALGVPIIYAPDEGEEIELNAVWDDNYVGVDPDTGAQVTSTSPRAGIRIADLGDITPTKDDRVTKGGQEYRISDFQKDGQGGAMLFLHRV